MPAPCDFIDGLKRMENFCKGTVAEVAKVLLVFPLAQRMGRGAGGRSCFLG